MTWFAGEFEGFRHGYAGTIYKGQGKTLDRTYLYHTEHWRAAASYVALTRQRDSAQVFVARETARDAAQLARQMARGEVRAASVAWATPEEVAKERTARQPDPATAERTAERARPGEARDEDTLRAKVREALAARQKSNAAAEKPEASQTPDTRGVRAEREADSAAAYWKAERTRPDTTRDEDSLRAKVRENLAARQMDNAKEEKPEAALSPDARRVLASEHEKTGQTLTGGAEDRAASKAGAARPPVTREVPEGPAVAADPPRQTAGRSGPEDERAPAPLLPAWRDATGQGRDSLGRGTSPEDLARVADKDPAARREVDARTRTSQVIYRDPEAAADALDALIRKSGNDLRAAARTLRQDGPESLGELRGREGWLAREAAKTERTYARSAAGTIPARLDQEARRATRRCVATRLKWSSSGRGTRSRCPVCPGPRWRCWRTCGPRSMRPIGRMTENGMTPNSGGGRKRSRAPGPPGVPIRAWPANWTGSWPRSDSGLARRGCGMLRVPPGRRVG